MESLYLLIPIALLFLGVAVACFLWAVNRRQFDDLEHQGRQVLFERENPRSSQRPPEVNPSMPQPDEQSRDLT